MQDYKYKKYTTIQAQGYMSTKLQNDVRIKTVTFQNMLHSPPSGRIQNVQNLTIQN